MGLKVIFMEPLPLRRIFLRRYSHGNNCPNNQYGCLSGFVPAGLPDEQFAFLVDKDGYRRFPDPPKIDHGDPSWPTRCERCGREFGPDDAWQVHQEQVFRRADTGELVPGTRNFPEGAIWYDEGGFYSRQGWVGPDGKTLIAKCPGGHDWCIDSRASNCTMKDDNVHRCWVRHGNPRDGTIHVDKNGNTCAAGAGSIQTGNWHGFLHNGEFVTC